MAPVTRAEREVAPSAIALFREIRRAARLPARGIADLQRERLSRLVAFARERSPLFRDLYGALPATVPDLGLLPPVTKRGLMERFDAWTTDPEVTLASAEAFAADPSRAGRLYLGRYVLFATSGTTGRPALFLHDARAASVYVLLAAARLFPGLLRPGPLWRFLLGGGRTASLIVTGGHFASAVTEGLFRNRFPRLSGRSRALSVLAPLPDLVAALNAFRPAVLGGYPTALALLAAERAAGRLKISPAAVLSGAERLSPAARGEMEAAFGCPVRDFYAASEFMGIAAGCGQGRLHINADWVVLEPVDEAYRPVPPGAASFTVLLTNLANRVQPLIRYDLGDRVTALPGPCPCGNPFPALQVEGRTDELLDFEGAGGRRIPVLPMAVAAVVEEAPGWRAWQVVRTGKALLCVRVEEAPGFDRAAVGEAMAERLRRYLDGLGLAGVSVENSLEAPRRHSRGGKLRQVYAEAVPGSPPGEA